MVTAHHQLPLHRHWHIAYRKHVIITNGINLEWRHNFQRLVQVIHGPCLYLEIAVLCWNLTVSLAWSHNPHLLSTCVAQQEHCKIYIVHNVVFWSVTLWGLVGLQDCSPVILVPTTRWHGVDSTEGTRKCSIFIFATYISHLNDNLLSVECWSPVVLGEES
jgi:hypothetical protein